MRAVACSAHDVAELLKNSLVTLRVENGDFDVGDCVRLQSGGSSAIGVIVTLQTSKVQNPFSAKSTCQWLTVSTSAAIHSFRPASHSSPSAP